MDVVGDRVAQIAEEFLWIQLPPGEFDWVEFKGRKSIDTSQPGVDENKVLDELAKQLSAFANSGGGVIVYGITNPANHQPLSVDDGGIAPRRLIPAKVVSRP